MLTIFNDFLLIFFDLGRFGEGFWEVFGKVFCRFFVLLSKIMILSKSLFYHSKTTIFKVLALNKLRKKRRKYRKKTMRICNRKIEAKKSHKNRFWEALGLHLGGVGNGLGPLLGALGRLLVVFWSFKIELFPSIGPRWAPRGLLDRFWVDLGRILGRFGKVLGRIWEDFWLFEQIVGRFWKCLT